MRGALLGVLVMTIAACDTDPDPNLIAFHEGQHVVEVAADDEGVYWSAVDDDDLAMMSLPTGATSPASIHLANTDFTFVDLGVAGDHLVYGFLDGFNLTWAAVAVPKIAGTPRYLYQDESFAIQVTGVDGHDGAASWAGRYGDPPMVMVQRADLDSDDVVTIADDLPAQNVLTVLDATHTYWTVADGIWRSDGTTTELFATTAVASSAITIDDASVYWIGDGVYRLGKDDAGGTPMMLAGDVDLATRLVVDETNLYWLDAGEQPVIHALPLDGGERIVLVEAPGLRDIAVASAGLYYTTNTVAAGFGDGSVVLLPRESL